MIVSVRMSALRDPEQRLAYLAPFHIKRPALNNSKTGIGQNLLELAELEIVFGELKRLGRRRLHDARDGRSRVARGLDCQCLFG